MNTVLSMKWFTIIYSIIYKTQTNKDRNSMVNLQRVSNGHLDHTKRYPCGSLKTALPPTWHIPSGWATFIKIQKPYPCFSLSLYYPPPGWKTTCEFLGSLLVNILQKCAPSDLISQKNLQIWEDLCLVFFWNLPINKFHGWALSTS